MGDNDAVPEKLCNERHKRDKRVEDDITILFDRDKLKVPDTLCKERMKQSEENMSRLSDEIISNRKLQVKGIWVVVGVGILMVGFRMLSDVGANKKIDNVLNQQNMKFEQLMTQQTALVSALTPNRTGHDPR